MPLPRIFQSVKCDKTLLATQNSIRLLQMILQFSTMEIFDTLTFNWAWLLIPLSQRSVILPYFQWLSVIPIAHFFWIAYCYELKFYEYIKNRYSCQHLILWWNIICIKRLEIMSGYNLLIAKCHTWKIPPKCFVWSPTRAM